MVFIMEYVLMNDLTRFQNSAKSLGYLIYNLISFQCPHIAAELQDILIKLLEETMNEV